MRLDPFSVLYGHNPMDIWHRLLADGERVGFDVQLGVWLIVGHDPVRRALDDAERFANAATLVPIMPIPDEVTAMLAAFDAPPVAVTADAPVHARTRAAIRTVIPNTAVRVEQRWGVLIRYRVDQLVDEIAAQDASTTVDLVERFARRLPMLIILDIIGVPVRNAHRIRQWSDGFVDLVWGNADPAGQLRAAQGLDALWQYCRSLIANRVAVGAAERNDDLIAKLLRYRAGDDTRLTEAEVAAIVLNLLVAGWETTAGLIGQALEHAVAEPTRWARLATDAHYASTHVEETLRHSPVLDGWLRITTTDVTLAGVTIPTGSRCLLLLGTANHDPVVFTNPERFDPDRAWLSHHLAFGEGPHHCVGAALARLEATTAVTALARRLPALSLTAGYRRSYRPNIAVRSHLALPATTGAARCPVADAAPVTIPS